jgi:hypothetical protein
LATAADLCTMLGAFETVALAVELEDAVILFFPMALGSSLSSFGDLSAVAMAGVKQGGRRAWIRGDLD